MAHKKTMRFLFSKSLLAGVLLLTCCVQSDPEKQETTDSRPPNIVVVFVDDMGYGDLGTYGHPTIHTPNLDQMAHEGQKWTNYYVAISACTPSRASLLTGRLPGRYGMANSNSLVFFPNSAGGLPETEITLAKALKEEGYATACVGKWHLGHLPQYLPRSHGFDSFFGIPYSGDMGNIEGFIWPDYVFNPKSEYFDVPLMRNEEILERPAQQNTLTKRYTEEAIRFIEENAEKPFFLYLTPNMPHVALFRSDEFAGKSEAGIYGDVVEEIDWSIGQIMSTLERLNLDENTLVVFSSDNGPWLEYKTHGGSAGLLREGKGSTYEGGTRVPGIFWMKNKIQPDVIADPGSTLDLFPTICKIAGVKIPEDRVYDGYDLSPVLFKGEKSPREIVYYYFGEHLYAVRKGDYKVHFSTRETYPELKSVEHTPPLLYHLGHDPSEKHNLADKHPEIIEEFTKIRNKQINSIPEVEDQMEKRIKE